MQGYIWRIVQHSSIHECPGTCECLNSAKFVVIMQIKCLNLDEMTAGFLTSNIVLLLRVEKMLKMSVFIRPGVARADLKNSFVADYSVDDSSFPSADG